MEELIRTRFLCDPKNIVDVSDFLEDRGITFSEGRKLKGSHLASYKEEFALFVDEGFHLLWCSKMYWDSEEENGEYATYKEINIMDFIIDGDIYDLPDCEINFLDI